VSNHDREKGIEAAARMLFDLGNRRVGDRAWEPLADAYRFEARSAIQAYEAVRAAPVVQDADEREAMHQAKRESRANTEHERSRFCEGWEARREWAERQRVTEDADCDRCKGTGRSGDEGQWGCRACGGSGRASQDATGDERLRKALSEAIHRMATVAGRLRLPDRDASVPSLESEADWLAEKLSEWRELVAALPASSPTPCDATVLEALSRLTRLKRSGFIPNADNDLALEAWRLAHEAEGAALAAASPTPEKIEMVDGAATRWQEGRPDGSLVTPLPWPDVCSLLESVVLAARGFYTTQDSEQAILEAVAILKDVQAKGEYRDHATRRRELYPPVSDQTRVAAESWLARWGGVS
jgi:hypothetical protein